MENKDLKYWRQNAEEDYITTPISVLRYISELEKGYTKEKVKELLETQRGNCYVAVLGKCRDEDIATAAITAPGPWGVKIDGSLK